MQNIIQYSVDHPVAFAILLAFFVVWSLSWKGIALWKSAHNSDLKWFIVLLLVNTVGLLEIFYIFVWSKRKNKNPVTPQQ